MTDHPQIRIKSFGYEAVLDEGIAEDVLMLWRRHIPTDFSCQGGPGRETFDDSHPQAGRYISCAMKLDVDRAQRIAEKLGWVDHVVWPTHDRTAFYGGSSVASMIRYCEGGVLLLPRPS